MRITLSTALTGALVGALLLPAAAQAGPPRPPTPDVRTLESTVPVYDPLRGIAMGISGLFSRTVAGTGGRTATIYASENAPLGAYVVVLTTPEGEETASWLASSGWLERADAEKLVLYALEPGASGSWGSAADEQEYVRTAVYDFAESRGNWYQPSESYYAVGYGIAGSVLQQVAMKDPLLFAAGAFVDASDIAPQYLDSLGESVFPTPDWNGDPVSSDAVPLPVWLVNSERSANADAVVEYWKTTDRTDSKGKGSPDGTVYTQQPDTLYGYVAESSRVRVVVQQKKVRQNDAQERKLTARIYDFLDDWTRYGGNVGGNTVGTRPDLDGLGVEYQTMVVDGRLREYLVYRPASARAAEDRGEDVPVVFSLHGSGMTMYMMFDYSRWWEVADREGFILVMPTSTNTGRATAWQATPTSSDQTFITRVLDEVSARYNVDERRVYLGGQSNGAAMTQAVGRNLPLAARFTALGATSFPSPSTDTGGSTLPFMMLFGEFDFWPWERTAPQVGGMLAYWIQRNHASGSPADPASEETSARRTVWSWQNAKGLDVVRYGVTWGRGHSIIPEEMPVLWDWYEQWTKNAAGENVPAGT
jgi:poly(3-hydroxybutyrate) depolymerase